MIIVHNTQRKVKINVAKLKEDTQTVLDALRYPDFDLNIWLTTNTSIRKYNRKYRKKNKATDVLSFPFYPQLKAGQRIKAKTEDDKNLGDLIISPEYMLKDLPKWGCSFEEHLQRILVHGICHLLGYDHIKDKDYNVMHKKETQLLKKIGSTKHGAQK